MPGRGNGLTDLVQDRHGPVVRSWGLGLRISGAKLAHHAFRRVERAFHVALVILTRMLAGEEQPAGASTEERQPGRIECGVEIGVTAARERVPFPRMRRVRDPVDAGAAAAQPAQI